MRACARVRVRVRALKFKPSYSFCTGTGAPGASTAKAPPVMAREHYGVERQNFFVEAFEKETCARLQWNLQYR